jgi:hypothetical protein
MGLATAAGVLVLAAVGLIVWHRSHVPQTPPIDPPAGGRAPTGGGQTPTPPTSIYDTPAPALPPPVPSTPIPAPPPVAGPPPTSAPLPPRPGASVPPLKPAPLSSDRPTPATTDALLTFSNVKMLNVDGRKGREESVLLSFVGGEITVVAKKGGTAIRSMPYQRLVRATYVHARDPRWDRSASSPPGDLDVPGGFLGRAVRHWLTLQTRADYLILHLDDGSWNQVIAAVERRTGLPVRRLEATGHK